jgi:hypothetical protein
MTDDRTIERVSDRDVVFDDQVGGVRCSGLCETNDHVILFASRAALAAV